MPNLTRPSAFMGLFYNEAPRRIIAAAMKRLVGFALVALSALSFGFLAIFARFAYADGAGTATVLFLRFAAGGAIMLAVLRARGLRLPRGRRLLGLFLMGAVGYAGQSFCYFTALRHASASLVALLLYAYPAFVTLLSAAAFKERITLSKAAALVLTLTGTALVVGLGGGGEAIGVALGLGAAAIYSVYIVCGSRLIGEGESLQASTVIMLSTALVYGLAIAAGGFEPPRGASGLAAIAGIALVSTVVAIVSFFAGMERIGPSGASLVSTIEPLVTVLAAAAFLGEPIGRATVMGGGLVIAGLIVLAAFSARRA
jgi:drug/metabolite transporter (DMT)-like permease